MSPKSVHALVSALDGVVTWLLAGLICVTPLAIGAVNRATVVAVEVAIFGLAGLWLARSTISGISAATNPAWLRAARWLLLPVAGMTVLLSVQLIPMPPLILRVLSPGTYRTYQIAFPGWPYHDRGRLRAVVAAHAGSGPGLEASASSQTSLFSDPPSTSPSTVSLPEAHRWQPLSLSPSATWSCLLEFIALAALFFLILLYPFATGPARSESRFVRRIVFSVAATATIVALLGIVEREWWNGKILWFYQPADWNGPLLTTALRASGPFVNPDHFANYLALTLPLVAAGALFPPGLIPLRLGARVRLLFGGATVLMLMAAALSLSRGGGLAIGVGITAMLAMTLHWSRDSAPAILRRLRWRAVPLAIVTFVLMAGLTFYLVGGPARRTIAMRVATTSATDFSTRAGAWRATIRMISEFAPFGVGAGAWPELFPHYQPPPASRYFFLRNAENDYLQFVAENGLAGLAVVVAAAIPVIWVLAAATARMPPERWPLFAGLAGGLGGALVQEAVDSSLHLPANALLFTILLALLLRVALAEPAEEREPEIIGTVPNWPLRLPLAAALLVLMIAAWSQDGRAYPYRLDHPSSLMMASRAAAAHPVMAAAHLAVAEMMPAAVAEAQRSELRAAIWLDPNEPLARDLLARNLLLAGRQAEALTELSRSVYRAPFLQLHYYLTPEVIPWLLPEEQAAIAGGFSRAVDSDFADAADQQANFYSLLGRDEDVARAYEHAAAVTADNSRRLKYLLKAGEEYARLHEFQSGERMLLHARRVAPDDPRVYSELADIYAAQHRLGAAVALITQGIKTGVDPYALEMALASAAETAGRNQLAETALVRALDYEPSFDATLQLGRVYFADGRFARAAATLQQAAKLNPQSAAAFTWLGRSQAADYDYTAAARAYRQAMLLAPADSGLRAEYRQFQEKIASDKVTGSP